MPAFAVFEPPMRAERPAARHTDRFVFLRERFSWGAFLFGPLWMIWRRLWLVLLLYLVVLGLIEFGLRRIGIGSEVRAMVFFLVAVLIGLEAVSLRRWTLLRRGWRDRSIVIADDLDMAERRFFDSWSADTATSPAPPPFSSAVSGGGVIGLFPEPGVGR
jgi:Protein of unknown function (DUF2628)